MDLSDIPIIDNHCHSLFRIQPTTVEEWHGFFTESYFAEIRRQHVANTLFYQWGQKVLGEFFGCEPMAEAILDARNAVDLGTLTQRVNRAQKISAWLVDYGYSTKDTYSHDELKKIAGVRVENILRLEPLIEQLIGRVNSFEELQDAYVSALEDLRAKGYVALKSIIAYRTGLNLGQASREDAAGAFPALKERATRDGALRLDAKPMLDYMIPLAVELAARQEFVIQIHTGFGDPDQDLFKSNPALLRPLFADQYRGCKIVLLHASYPYARTLGYLAAVYPNVYADFGLAIPFVTGEARAVLRELFGLAPASKILYSSDAFHIPELFYLGAVLGRDALGDVLDEFVGDGLIGGDVAREWAEMALHRNAERVYALQGESRE